MVKEVWRESVKNVHPFQKGDTNQGTKHCMTIVKYLNRLENRINVELSDAVILLISAAVHDIGKSIVVHDIVKYAKFLGTGTRIPHEPHEKVGSTFIQSNYSDLKIQGEWQPPVSNIVEYHAGNVSLNSVTNSSSLNVPDGSGATTNLNINIQKLAAIFRLCDVADMTHTRISDTVFSLNEKKKNALDAIDQSFYQKLFSHKNIDKLLLKKDHFDVIVSSAITDPSELNMIKDSIKYDNDDLQNSATSKILATNNIPSEFWINGKRH